MIGLGKARIASIQLCRPSMLWAWTSGSRSRLACRRCSEPPALNHGPSPASTTLRTSALLPARLSVSMPAAYMSGPSALRCEGLDSSSTIVPSCVLLL